MNSNKINVRRSFIFTPGLKPEMFPKAIESGADMVCIELEDGIAIQPALYVYPNMYYNPPVERIDGIQVIKGSGTVKFGPQTMGGIVNYYTNCC